jgi:hypothetical protein
MAKIQLCPSKEILDAAVSAAKQIALPMPGLPETIVVTIASPAGNDVAYLALSRDEAKQLAASLNGVLDRPEQNRFTPK